MDITTIPLVTPSLNLPKEKGSYLFIFQVTERHTVQIGRLGTFDLPSGVYHYCGSAQGGGGISARVMRHLNLSAPKRWHIDYLKPIMKPISILYAIIPTPLECIWAQMLANQPSATVPIKGFGASDCKNHCPAHLIRLSDAISDSILKTE